MRNTNDIAYAPEADERSEGVLDKVYYLDHSYTYGKHGQHANTQGLGVYSTRELAEEAIGRFSPQEGFRDYPLDCFRISELVVDRDAAWTEGFSFPSHHINPKSESEAWPD